MDRHDDDWIEFCTLEILYRNIQQTQKKNEREQYTTERATYIQKRRCGDMNI